MKKHAVPIVAVVLVICTSLTWYAYSSGPGSLLANGPRARPVFPLKIEEVAFLNRSRGVVKEMRVRSGTLNKSTGYVIPNASKTYGYDRATQPNMERQLEVRWEMVGEPERSETIDLEKLGAAERIAARRKITIVVDATGEIVIE